MPYSGRSSETTRESRKQFVNEQIELVLSVNFNPTEVQQHRDPDPERRTRPGAENPTRSGDPDPERRTRPGAENLTRSGEPDPERRHRPGAETQAGNMLYLIGLGLGDAADITVKGLQAVKSCSRVYLEAYTSILTVGKEALEEYYGMELILADRDLVEQGADEILKDADVTDVAFLVVGDPFGATTHSDLVLRAVHAGIPYKVIHNASIMNAVGCCGLQLYNFGETVSLVFWTDTWRPESFYDKICKNRTAGLHTLCLLDIKVKEQSIENMMRGKKIYEPPRFMTVSQAADQLIQIIQRRREEGAELGVTENTVCVGVARLGADDQRICTATLRQLVSCDLGGPLHSLVITGQLHPLEVDMLRVNAEPNALEHLHMLDSSTYCS